MEKLCSLLLMCTAVLSTTTSAQVPDEPPLWAEGIPVFGELQVDSLAEECDLCNRLWTDGLVVAQDRKDTVYILDLTEGRCEIYSPEGELTDTFQPSGWQGLARSPIFTSFTVNPAGDLFAAASGNNISLFTRKKVEMTNSLPTFVTSLGFIGNKLVVAKLPVRIPGKDGRPERVPYLLAWLDKDGEIDREDLAADPARGPAPMAIAMTQGVEVVAEPSGPLWVLDESRFYRVRRVSSTGQVMANWISDRLLSPVSFSGDRPEELEESPPLAEGTFQPVSAKAVVKDALWRDGFLWVLANESGLQVIDVFDNDLSGPLARLGLVTSWRIAQIAVTDDALWVFPPDDRGAPKRIERLEDWIVKEMAYSGPASS